MQLVMIGPIGVNSQCGQLVLLRRSSHCPFSWSSVVNLWNCLTSSSLSPLSSFLDWLRSSLSGGAAGRETPFFKVINHFIIWAEGWSGSLVSLAISTRSLIRDEFNSPLTRFWVVSKWLEIILNFKIIVRKHRHCERYGFVTSLRPSPRGWLNYAPAKQQVNNTYHWYLQWIAREPRRKFFFLHHRNLPWWLTLRYQVTWW